MMSEAEQGDSTNRIIIGVAGGTGSGKTTVSSAILDRVGRDEIAYLQHDSYYRDRSFLPPEERAKLVTQAELVWEDWAKRMEDKGLPGREVLDFAKAKKAEIEAAKK